MGQGAPVREVQLHDMTSSANVKHGTSEASVVEFRPQLKVARIAEEEPPHFDSSSFAVADTSQAVEFLIRLLDVVGALGILTLTFPVMLLAAVLIKLTSRGGVFYRQERVGKNGRIFELVKFRTMIDDAEKHVGPVWAVRDDHRITPVGRILRRTRLDELPQLYNILCDHMSLVGPRPERPFFVERHKALQGARLVVKPGLTGLAQVRSFYDLKPAHKVKYDYLYIQNRSLLLNIYILLRTVPVLFTKKGW